MPSLVKAWLVFYIPVKKKTFVVFSCFPGGCPVYVLGRVLDPCPGPCRILYLGRNPDLYLFLQVELLAELFWRAGRIWVLSFGSGRNRCIDF